MELEQKYSDLHAFSLGDTRQMANNGLSDVIKGKQTATSGDYLSLSKEEKPFVGKMEIVLDGDGKPGCVIKYHTVDTKQFSEINDEFAKAESCRDLAEWREIHEAYFRRKNCFALDMKIYRLYFDVIEVFKNKAVTK